MASPSVLGPKSHFVSDIVDHDLNLEKTPGFEACINRARCHAEKCRAHFHKVVEKDQRQKVKKPSHLASTELVKNDVDAEHHARVRRAESIPDQTSSSSPFENDEFHREKHKDGPELELLSSVVSSPSKCQRFNCYSFKPSCSRKFRSLSGVASRVCQANWSHKP